MGDRGLRGKDSLSGYRSTIPGYISCGDLLIVDFNSLPERYPRLGWEEVVKRHRGLWVWLSNREHTPSSNVPESRFRAVQNDIVIVLGSPVAIENMPIIHWGPRRETMMEVWTPRGIGVVQWHPAFRIL